MQPEHEHTIALKNLLTTFLGDDEFANLEKLEEPEAPEFIQQAKKAANRQKATPNGTLKGRDVNGHPPQPEENTRLPEESKSSDTMELDVGEEEEREGGNNLPPPPSRMTTRSLQQQQQQLQQHQQQQQQQQQQHAASPPSSGSFSPRLEIDPFFFPPNYAVDRDFGIPAEEAKETRQLLLAAVQRQEEFMRGLNKVYAGLLHAKRKKQDVWRWCRAIEGVREHRANKTQKDISDITEEEMASCLTDNEDWYDRDEWKLDQPLLKGKEEEEEEEKTKKTRGRRA